VYRILDDATGAIVDAVGWESNVMVLSDHGGGPLRGEVNLNAWLAEEGYLEYSSGAKQTEELARRGLFKLMEQRQRIPERVRDAVKQRAPWLRDRVRNMNDFSVVDWQRTRAFAYGSMGSLVVNVRGRDLQGIVEPGAEYDALCAELAAKALDLRDPDTGEKIVAAVHRRDALFHGPQLEKIPDLIVEFADYKWMGKGDLRQRGPTMRPAFGRQHAPFVGSHRRDGIVAISGRDARAGGQVHASLEDIAPTILYLMGEAVPLDFEGRVIEEALDVVLLERRPPRYRDPEAIAVAAARAYDENEAAQVAERLRGLGYLE
jgi:predicted AlkP superfamily phosphohydrolase/phosphomutase